MVWNVGSAVTDKSYQLFNIGCWDSLNDRALGTDPTGTAGTVIQLALTNNTGNALNGVIFSYTEKCLTNGSTSNGSYTDDGTERLELPGYSFFYSLTGDTNATNWYWGECALSDQLGQGTSSDSGPVAITFPTPLPANGVMYFRWADDNCVASSPDQMYAIDNISITANNPNGPVVSFTSPTNNQNYIPGTAITLSATATDLGTNITSVSFYVGSTVLSLPRDGQRLQLYCHHSGSLRWKSRRHSRRQLFVERRGHGCRRPVSHFRRGEYHGGLCAADRQPHQSGDGRFLPALPASRCPPRLLPPTAR